MDFERRIRRQKEAERATDFCVTEKVKAPDGKGGFEDWIVAVVGKKKIELGKVGDDNQIRKVLPEDLRAWQDQAEKNTN